MNKIQCEKEEKKNIWLGKKKKNFFFGWDWILNKASKWQSRLLFEPCLQSILLWLFCRWGSPQTIFPGWL
jgi:hypothetical protein